MGFLKVVLFVIILCLPVPITAEYGLYLASGLDGRGAFLVGFTTSVFITAYLYSLINITKSLRGTDTKKKVTK